MGTRNLEYAQIEERVAQDYQRFLAEAEHLLHSVRELSGDSADLARQRLEDKVSQAKVRLEAARSHAAERGEAAMRGTAHWAAENAWTLAGIGVAAAAAIAGYLWFQHSRDR